MSNQSYTDAAAEKLHNAKEKTKEMAGDVRDKIAGAAEATRDKAVELKDAAAEKLGHGKECAEKCGHDYKERAGQKIEEAGNRVQSSH